MPTLLPSGNPSTSPSVVPTVTPQCPAIAEIACVTPGGTQCKDLQGVSETKCQCPDCPREARFRYIATKCSSDIHFSLCQDMNEDQLPTSVRIEITNTAMSTTYFDQLVDFGTDAVAFDNGACVEEELAVFINDPDTGALLQVLEISLGCTGSSGTELLSQFGSMEFSGYTCQNGMIRNCYGAIDWTFLALSDLPFEQVINRFELVFNGESLNLLAGESTDTVAVGGSNREFSQSVRTGLQFCSQIFFDIEVLLEATEPSGETCISESSLNFAVVAGEVMTLQEEDAEVDEQDKTPLVVDKTELDETSSCGLTTSIDCVLGNGSPCETVVQPQDLSCHGDSGIASLSFSYQNTHCSGAKNSQPTTWLCTDSSALYEGIVGISCTSVLNDAELNVSPSAIGPGGTVTVAPDSGTLPSTIMCVLKGPGERILQKNLIDVSGLEEIYLGDQFGALQVEACGQVSCQDQFSYQMSIQNTGTEQMLVTGTTFVFNGSGGTALALERNGLDPGDKSAVEVTVEVDICRGRTYEAAIEVSVALASGEFCHDTDDTRLELPHLWS